MQGSVLINGRRRSVVTLPQYRLGMKPANYGKRYPAEIYTREEIHRLMACMGRGTAGTRNRAIVAVMWRCGLRVAEVLALEPKDVDLEHGTVRVLHGKGDRARLVGIDPEAIALVEVWLERRRGLGVGPRRPLFCVISQPHVGKAIYSSCIREMLKDSSERAGIEKRVHPHGFRHTFAVELSRAGVPLKQIQRALGHSSVATTDRYLDHLEPLEVVRMMQAREWEPVSHVAA